ncbi:hypothetical protein VE01_09325 [Pseudogymnoascus verrucosus]|uniref:Major facilitator superfamily (MFS) profile domain-containing protein n=1 Tax=Pseudogymnoascus verrucosus TaxID=342668 RepID=A0A1B8G7F6_9PEZI|nr:uncharacterized protein VE01_09325 [Pseudogymnoascus verrucosus]OBT91768.2 hypothetical protein VE01_09325 [Pseudogymnoascus verrucosus]
MFESKIRGKTLKRIMATCCATSFCMYGYDAGVLGGVQTTEPFHRAMGYPTGTYVIPMIASSYTLAAAVCSLMVTMVGMPLGRRNCILLGNLLVIIGASLQASSWSVAQIIVARIICGFGIGFISCSVPTYQAEMSTEIKERGPQVAVTCVFLVAGAALAYWVDFGFTSMTNQASWRLPIGFQIIFAIIGSVGMFILPDTPRWYYAKGYINDPAVQSTKQDIISSIKLEEDNNSDFNILDLIWDRSYLRAGRRIRISFMILALQQMMGINLSVYYSTVIFAQVGLSPFLTKLLAAIMNTLFAAGTIPLVYTIEKVGRRNVMLYSAIVLTICMSIFVAMISLPNPSASTQWIAVAAIFVYNIVFGYGWIGVCWLYGPEIAPLKLRHAGAAAGAFGEWLFSFITVFAGGIALENVGWKIWLWMALSCAAAVPFVWFLCPETSGKTLEEIDFIFTKIGSQNRDPTSGNLTSHDLTEKVTVTVVEKV